MGINLGDIAGSLGLKIDARHKDKNINEVVIDSRKVGQGDLFIGIKGENFDGNEYITEAVKAGAIAVVTDRTDACDIEAIKISDAEVFVVKDTCLAFLEIASFYREHYDVKVLAVTGSVGKTSTKELAYSVLSQDGKTLKNEGNFNNHIGVPLTLVKLDASYKYAVIEMGMDDFGQIELLAKYTKPDIAIITNIGTSHIGILGSRENIFKAKSEILPYIKSKTVIVCGDDDFLPSLKNTYENVICYGKSADNDVILNEVDAKAKSFVATYKNGNKNEKYEIKYQLDGAHNAVNALSSIALADYFSLSKAQTIAGISSASLTGSRMRVVKVGDTRIIDDAYNASPESIRASIAYFDEICEAKSLLILGDVLEQGDFEKAAHESIGRMALSSKADAVVFIGISSKYAYDVLVANSNKDAYYFTSTDEFLASWSFDDEYRTILLKASNGMKFTKILDRIMGR